MTKNNQEQELSSLAEIMLRKELVQKDIDADDEKIKTLWNSLFKKPDALSKSASTSKRISSLMSMGAGALDGAILVRKLKLCKNSNILYSCIINNISHKAAPFNSC